MRALAAAITLALAAGTATSAAAQAPANSVLRLPFPRYDGGLTPYTFELGRPLMTLVYDTLMWRDAAGIPRPWLARTVQRSDGGRRVTIQLRSDARWHDGRRVTAADVVFTMAYVAAHRQPRYTPQLADVRQVRATGPLTVRIDLHRPSLGFEDQPLSDLPILPRHLWRDLPAGRRAPVGLAVGSGPYRLVQADPREGYVLRANRQYFMGTPRPALIRVPIIGDAERTFDALRARRVDVVPLSLPRDVAARLDSELGISVRRGASYVGTALVLNTRRPPFDNVRARRAVAAALDLQRIARSVRPAAAADRGYVHPASRWAPAATIHTTDLAVATRAFGELKLPRIRVFAPASDPARSEAGRQVVLALKRAGAAANLVAVSAEQLSRAIGEEGDAPDFDAAITGIPPLVSQDPGYLSALFGSDPATGTLNASRYRSPAFDAAARRVAGAPDVAARSTAILAELRLLNREAPAIPLFFADGAFAYRSEVHSGWTYIKGIGILDKRSFLPGGSPAAAGGRRTPDAAGDAQDDGGGSPSVLTVISLVLLGMIAVLAALALLQRRRST